jgi:type I restriction enzyme S subunit
LRFPEFEGEWERRKLREIGDINPAAKKLPDKFIYIDLEGVVNGELIKEQEINLDEAPSRAQRLLEINDILFQMVRPYQKNNLFFNRIGNYVASTGYAQLRTEGNSKFIYHYLHFQKFVDKVIEKCTGTSYPAINSTDFANIIIAVTSLIEQQKIASFLSLLDDRIATQNKIIEGLTVLKAGLSKKIFIQELGFSKFPDGWEKKELGEIGEIVNGLTYSPNDIAEKGVLVLRSSNIQNRELTFDGSVFVNVNSFNAVLENDILICVRNGSKNLIGKNAIIKKEHEGFAFGAFMAVYRSRYNKFLFHWFDTEEYKEEVRKNLGATINSINGSDLKKFKAPFPKEKEQQKIATFLSYIDQKIELEAIILNQFTKQKKYLLQQMFI